MISSKYTSLIVPDGWKVAVVVNDDCWTAEVCYDKFDRAQYQFCRINEAGDIVDESEWKGTPGAAFKQVQKKICEDVGHHNGKLYVGVHYDNPQKHLRELFDREKDNPAFVLPDMKKFLEEFLLAPPTPIVPSQRRISSANAGSSSSAAAAPSSSSSLPEKKTRKAGQTKGSKRQKAGGNQSSTDPFDEKAVTSLLIMGGSLSAHPGSSTAPNPMPFHSNSYRGLLNLTPSSQSQQHDVISSPRSSQLLVNSPGSTTNTEIVDESFDPFTSLTNQELYAAAVPSPHEEIKTLDLFSSAINVMTKKNFRHMLDKLFFYGNIIQPAPQLDTNVIKNKIVNGSHVSLTDDELHFIVCQADAYSLRGKPAAATQQRFLPPYYEIQKILALFAEENLSALGSSAERKIDTFVRCLALIENRARYLLTELSSKANNATNVGNFCRQIKHEQRCEFFLRDWEKINNVRRSKTEEERMLYFVYERTMEFELADLYEQLSKDVFVRMITLMPLSSTIKDYLEAVKQGLV